MEMYAAILFVSFIISPIFAENVVVNGSCPGVPLKVAFNETKYEGKWFEIQRFPNTLVVNKCSTATYKWISPKFNVTYDKNTDSWYELRRQIPALYDPYINGTYKDNVPYSVIDTDYTTFSVVFGCSDINATHHIQRFSLLSRKNTLDQDRVKNIKEIYKTYGIKVEKLTDVQQDNKACGRSGGADIALPSLISGIIVMLITRIM